VRSSLFETCAYLVGQHIAQLAVTGEAARPMPERISAWAIYDVFETARPGEQVFIGVVSDGQWQAFTRAFALDDLAADPAYATNNQRVEARDKLVPRVRALAAGMTREDLLAKLEEAGVAFAPIARPQDLLDDPHLNANGAFVDLTLTNGKHVKLPALPVEIDGRLPGVRHDLAQVGEDTEAVLRGWGFSDAEVAGLVAKGAVEAFGHAARPAP
jgi:crotonobetainyl-CoA:carnitine CoA-transferase CaiB-like acyl-CoA transferase